MDTTDNTEFNAGISQLYDEKDPVKLAGLFSSLVSQLKPIHLVDNLGLSLFQHFCILSDRLEPAPEAMRDVMRLFTNLAKGAKAPAELFAFFNMSAIPKPILAKAPTSEKPKRKSKVGPSKPWGGPALHYLAKRKRYATLETVLAAWSEFPEAKVFNMNATDQQGDTFMHLVIRQRQYVLAYRLLTAGHYTFDLKLPNALGKTIPSLLSEGISSGLYEAVAKDDLKTASELLQPIRKPLALPLDGILEYPELKTSMLHHVAKKGSVAMLKLFLEAIPTPDLRRLLSQKDVSSKDTLLLYVCRGCGFAAILEVLHVSEKGQLAARNHRWDTCLHLIALNRKLTLGEKVALVKEIVGARPELCGMSNLEGYRPLPLWILALSQSQEADMAWEVLEFLGKHTDMRVWQERAAVDKENAARLRQFTARFGSPAFGSGYKKEQMGKALGTPQKTKAYRVKRNLWIKKWCRSMRSSGTISPLEAAVVAQRPEWVKTCLDSWGLCGDLIMVDGRHVLSFALENSGIDTVRLLMQKGQLKPRFVLDSGEGFNLDGVMVQGVYQAWRDLYRVRNLAAVPSLLAEEYKEFQGETCHQRVDLYQAKRAKIELCEAEQVDDSKEKARLEILVQALGLYLSTVRSAPTQDCGSEIYKKWKSPALLPLCDAGSILGCAIGVPELADLSMMIMTEQMAAKKEGCGRKAELALERGDFALLERLDAKFHSDVTECISEIDIATVLTTSLRFTDQPNKVWDLAIRLGAKTNGDMSVLLTNRLRICDIVYGRCNWYNPLHLLFNRFQAVKTVTKYLGEHWDLVNYYPKVPAFALAVSQHPVPAEMKDDMLARVEPLLDSIWKDLRYMTRGEHTKTACAMLNYAHKLACAYVDAKMKAMGSTFSLASPEFVFYFQTFRRYLKKSQGEDTEIIRILGSPGIEAIKFYSHFCGSLLRKLKKALPAAVKRTTATSEIGKTLRTLFVYPTLRCYRGGKREWHEKATQELLGEREALPMIEQVMVRNTLLWPYVAYRLFSHGRRRRTCDTLDCCCHKIYAMLAKELPLVGPTSICKFLWQDLDNEVHLNVVETCLGRLEALCGGDQKHVEALKVLYELKHKRALAKYPDPELRAAVHLGPAQANPIVYGLISSKYGYMLCWMCRRRMPQEQCQKVSARYNLPLGLASVEPVRPSRDHFAPPTDRVWVRNPKIAPEDVKPAAQTLKSAATKKPRRAKAKRVTTGKKRTQKPVTVTAKRKLKPKYVPCSAVTCPIIELCKTFMTSLSPSFEVQGIVLSMTDQSRKLLTQQLFYYLSKYQLMTPTIFLPLWTQQQSKEILLVRPTEQTAIYEFVAGTCDPKIVLGILVHALQSQDRAYLKAVLSCCVRFAVVTRNAKALMTLYAAKLFLGEERCMTKTGITHAERILVKLYNLPAFAFCLSLHGTAELATMWEQFFAMTAAARNDRLIFHSSRHQPNPKLIGLLAVTSPATLSQYLSFISQLSEETGNRLGPYKIAAAIEVLSAAAHCARVPQFVRFTNECFEALQSSEKKPEPVPTMRCDDATLANAAKMVLGLIASNEESLTAKTACKLAEAIVEINSEQMHDVQERCVKVLGENEKECGEMRYGISLLRRYSAMKFLRTAEIHTLGIAETAATLMKPEQLLCEEETLCRLPRPALHAVIKKAADRILASPANLMVLRGVLVFSLRYQCKEAATKLFPLYIKSSGENLEFYSRLSKRFYSEMKFPLLRVAKLGRTDPEFAMSLISQFPTQPNCLNVSAGADKNFQIELALQKLINVTPLELSIVYHAQALALRLLSDPEYARYAREHADDVLALCLRAGQGELFMKLKSELIRSITLQHMYLALEYCSEQFCVALLKELSSNFTPSEVLGYADPASGNTILHQIAKNGLRTVLLFLAESGVFNFCAAANRKEKLEVLRVKNVDQLSPFALAVLADNLDIAGALYVTPASLSELSDAEFSIVTSPSSTTRAFTAFIHPELYSQPERKIWAVLFPDRDRVLKLFAKAAEVPMRPGCIPVYVPHNVASTSIDYVKRMMDAGAVCMVIQMAMFRRDTFEVAGLLEQKFGVREKLCAGLRGENVWLLSLAYVFVRLGLFPAKREEIEPAITRVHFFNDSACLGLMQALELLKRNSATAYEALKDESRDSVFISPYRFFRQTGKPADGFTFDELDCILPLDGRELKATYYGLDLAQLAVHFAANQFCDSFTAIVLFAQKFDRDLLNRIMSRMNIEHVLTMFLEGVPERLPWAISVFGTEFRLSYDPKTGVIYAGMDETRETAIRLTHSTLAGLIYYALFQGPKMLRIVQQTTDSGKSIARLVLESVVQITHKYSGINIPRKFPKQLRSFYIGKKATGLNTTIRTNRILGRLLSRAFGIPKAKDLMVIAKSGSETPEKMLIPESGLAEILATSLLPDKEKMFSVENEFMQFEIEGGAQMVLKAAERLAEATGRGLAETVCMLFTDQYIFAVAALRDQVWNRQCILRVRVRLQEGAAAACKFESFQPKSSSSGIDVDIAAAEYVFDPVALSKSGPETLEEMNRRLYLDLSLAKLSNFSLSKRRRARNFTFVLDMESVKKCVVPLERRFFKDISFQITKWCDSETNRVLYRISRYKKYAATNPGSSWTRKLPTLGADVTCKIRFVPRSDWDKTPHPWGEYARRSFQACFSSCEGDVPSPKETELIVLVNDRNVEDGNQPELMSVPESYGEYPAARLFYSESTFSRQLIEFWRGTAPILEVDIKGFCELIAVPLSELFAKAGIDTMPIANTRYDNPILLAEDYMLGNGGRVLRDVMRQFFIDFSSLKAHYGVNAKAIMVLFEEDSCLEPEREEEKGLSLPLLDKLIWITDMRISTTEAEVCSLTFKCRLDWKRTGKIVIPTLDDQKEALARGEEPVQAYMSRLCNIYTILDGLISLSTVVDRTLGYRFWKRNRTERNLRLSTLFKDAKVTSFIDRASLIRTLIMLCPERSLPSEEYCKQKCEMLALIHSFEARLSPLYLSEMLARCIPAQTEDVLSALIQEKTRARLAAAKTQKRRTAIAKGKRVVADGRKALAGYLPQRIRFSFATETEAKAHEKTQIIGDELEIVLLAKHGMVEFDMRNKMPWEWLVRFQTRAFVAVEGFKTRMRGLGLNPGEVCFDFEGVKMVPEVQRPELSSVVDKLLVAVYDAMRLIPKLERKNLANSLSYNMNPKGSRVERVKLFSLVQRFLRSHPIFISFRGTESPESSSIDSLLSITDSRMSLVCCFEPTAPGQLVAPQNYASLISERLAKEICLLEVKALRDTMQEERKTSAAALHRDEKDPLGLGYADAISLLNVVLRLLFHDSSNRNLVKIDIDEKGATESKPLLRMLVAVPALLEHIANALRIAEGLSACPKIGEVAVTLKCGRPQDDFWELSLKEAELSICVQPSATDCIIPTQDAVLSRLILMSCGPAKEPLRCFPVNVGTKEPELLSPLLSDSPLLVAFHVEGCTGELPDEVLACAVSLSSPTEPSVSIVLEKAEKGELRVRLDHLSKTNDLTKLAIRVGNSLAFTEVFIPPKMVLDVYKLLEFSQKTRPMSKEDEKTQKMLFPRSAHMRTFNASYFVPLHSAAGIRHDSPVFKGLKARDVLAAFGCRVKEVSFKNAPIIKWHSAVKVAEGLLCVSLEVIVGENIAQCVAGKDGKLLPIIPEGDAAKLAKAVGKEEGDVRGLKAYYVVCVGDDNAVLGTQPIPESRKS